MKHLHRHGIDFVQYWINHEQAQKSWAKEFRVKYNEKIGFLEILEAQILKESPDVVYKHNINHYLTRLLQEALNRNQKRKFSGYYGVKVW